MSKKKKSGLKASILDNLFTVLSIERYISDPKHQKEIGVVGNKHVDVIQLTLSYKDEKIKVILDHSLNCLVQKNKIQAGSRIDLTDFTIQANEASHNGVDILIVKDLKVVKKDPKDTDDVQIGDDNQEVEPDCDVDDDREQDDDDPSEKVSVADSMETHYDIGDVLEDLSDSDSTLEDKEKGEKLPPLPRAPEKGEKLPPLPRAPEDLSDSPLNDNKKIKKILQSPRALEDISNSDSRLNDKGKGKGKKTSQLLRALEELSDSESPLNDQDRGKGKKSLQPPRAPEPVAGPSWMPDTSPLRLNQEPDVSDDDTLQDLTEVGRLVQLQKENPVEGPLTSSRSYFNSVWSSVEVVGKAWKINKPVRDSLGHLQGDIMHLGDLSLNQCRTPMVCVKVLLKLRLFLYPKPDRNDKWPMQAKILVGDGSGICTVVLWNRMAAEWYYSISVGDVLLLRHFTKRRLYRPLEREKLQKAVGNKCLMDMELSVNFSSPPAEVIKIRAGSVPDTLGLPPVMYNLVSRKQVGTLQDNTIVDVAGVVCYVGRYEREPMKRFSHDSGSFWVRQWIHLQDGTMQLPFVVQIYHASIGLSPVDMKPGNLLLCTNVRVVNVFNKKEGPQQKKLTFLTSTEETEVKVLDEDALSTLTTQTQITALVNWSKTRPCTLELENAGVGGYTPGLELPSCSEDVLADVKDIPPIPSESWFEVFGSLKYREIRQVSVYANLVSVLYHPGEMEAENENSESRPILMISDGTVSNGTDALPTFGTDHVNDMFPMRFSNKNWPAIKKRLDFPCMELKEGNDEQDEGAVDIMARPYFTFLWRGLKDQKMFYSHLPFTHHILKECDMEDILSGELAFDDDGEEASYGDMEIILATAAGLFGVKCHVILNLYQTSTDNTEIVLKRAFKKGQLPIQKTPDQENRKESESESEPKRRKVTPPCKPSSRLSKSSGSELERPKSNASHSKQQNSVLQTFLKTSPKTSLSPTILPSSRLCKKLGSRLERPKSNTSHSKQQSSALQGFLKTSPMTSPSPTLLSSSRLCKTSGSKLERLKCLKSNASHIKQQSSALQRFLKTSPTTSPSPTGGERCHTNKVKPPCTTISSSSSPTEGERCSSSKVLPSCTKTASSPSPVDLEHCVPMKVEQYGPGPSCSILVESQRRTETELNQTHSYKLSRPTKSRFLNSTTELPILPVPEFYGTKLKGKRRSQPLRIWGPLRRSPRLKVVKKVVENTENDAVIVTDSDSPMDE